MSNRHVMIDLETTGVTPGCGILSIGTCGFYSGGIGGYFYVGISRHTCINAGLREDPETLSWWSMQPAEARKVLTLDRTQSSSLGAALVGLASELSPQTPEENVIVWSNGADFDLPILAYAYHVTGQEVPWKPYNGRCYRTLKNQRPGITFARTGLPHNALNDAIDQAEHAVRLLNDVGGW